MSGSNIQSSQKLVRAAPLPGANKQIRLAGRLALRAAPGSLNAPLQRASVDALPSRASLG